MKKTIITVVGKDTVGIIAKVCTYLAENNVNILDISQTIVQGFFNMMMPGSKGQKAVHACMIRLLNLGPAKHEKVAIYVVKPPTS